MHYGPDCDGILSKAQVALLTKLFGSKVPFGMERTQSYSHALMCTTTETQRLADPIKDDQLTWMKHSQWIVFILNIMCSLAQTHITRA